MTWLIGAGGFAHVIAGSSEVLYAAWRGEATWARATVGLRAAVTDREHARGHHARRGAESCAGGGGLIRQGTEVLGTEYDRSTGTGRHG